MERHGRTVSSPHHARIRAGIPSNQQERLHTVRALEELIEILGNDPHNRSGRHKIKKLAGLKPGEGQWRVRWRDYRLRYDIFGSEVVLHSFRHRKDAY